MNLLAIAAHPDDDAIFCGGTLAKHAERGDDVLVTYMTRGELGGTGKLSPFDLAETREREARDASEILGVSTSFLDFKDGRIEYAMEHRITLVDLIRNHDPDLLLTHFKEDPHPDHRATSRLVTDAYYMASLPHFGTDHDPSDPDNIYYFGKPDSDFEPETFVDISDTQSTKEQAIRCHESQVEFLNAHGGIDRSFDDLTEDVRARDRVWGQRCNVEYAEGFVPLHQNAVDSLE